MGRDQKAMLKVPSAARKRRRPPHHSVLAAGNVKRKMNSEVGIRDADFTYIKSIFPFEVGIRDADFGTAKVGIPCADFGIKICFEVGIRDADFGTVEVGIPYADFRFFVYGLRIIFVFN